MDARLGTRTARATDAFTGFMGAYAFLVGNGANQPYFLGARRDSAGDLRYWDFRVVGLGRVTVVVAGEHVYLQ